jgi:hypothetical protein
MCVSESGLTTGSSGRSAARPAAEPERYFSRGGHTLNDETMKTKYAFLYVVLGMVLGTIIFGTLFYFLDKSKGWNPFGW